MRVHEPHPIGWTLSELAEYYEAKTRHLNRTEIFTILESAINSIPVITKKELDSIITKSHASESLASLITKETNGRDVKNLMALYNEKDNNKLLRESLTKLTGREYLKIEQVFYRILMVVR